MGKERDRERQMSKKTAWILSGLAVLLLLLLTAITLVQIRGGRKEAYPVVCLGDSIIGNVRDDTSVTGVMESLLDVPVANAAFGGTCMSLGNHEYHPNYAEDSLNLASLADSIAAGDFDVQKYDIAENKFGLPYFKDALWEMTRIDFSKAKIIFIEHGINDYSAGRPLEDPEDPKNVYTYGGALRYSIETIKKAYPDVKLVLVTPLYCYFQENGQRAADSENADFGYGTLEAYAKLELQIAQEYGLDCIDNFHEFGLNSENVDEYTEDGLHLNEKGRHILAEILAEYVKSNL